MDDAPSPLGRRTMRILIETYYYLPHIGGGTWYFYHVARRLARRGHDVTLLAPRVQFRMANEDVVDPPEPRLVVEHLSRVRLPLWCSAFAGLLLFRPRFLQRARRSDVLLGQFHPHHSVAFAGVVLGKVLGRPVVVRVEDYRRWMFGDALDARSRFEFLLAGPMNALNEWAARHASALLVVDTFAAAYFGGNQRLGARLIVSPNGVDLAAVERSRDRAALREELRLPNDAPVIAFVGRYSGAEYRVDLLLDAFGIVVKSRPDAVLLLVGDSLSPGLRTRFHGLLGAGSVRELGPVPQNHALAVTALADVAVGPLGPTRTTPLKVVEALVQGTPVVVGSQSVGPELTAFGPMVHVVESDPGALAESLLSLLDSPRPPSSDALRSRMRDYDWDTIATGVESELSRLVTPSRDQAGVRHHG